MSYIYIIIYFSLCSLYYSLSIDESLYFLSDNSPLGITIYLGTPFQTHTVTLDISESDSWIHKDIFDSSQSSTFKTTSIQNKPIQTTHFTFIGDEAIDVLHIANTVIDNFTFYNVNTFKGQSRFLSTLSLGRHSHFINNLYNNNKISYKSFSIDLSDSDNKGILHIGNAISELNLKTILKHQCKLINSNDDILKHKWGCQLTHMYVGNIDTNGNNVHSLKKDELYKLKHNEQSYGFFESIYTKIFVPYDVIEYLDKNYFINEQSGICVKQEKNNKDEVIYKCDQTKIKDLTKNVYFVFDEKLSVFLTNKELVSCTSPNNCEFVIAYHKDINYFGFGVPFMKLFQIYFDYTKEDIALYSNTNFVNVKIRQKSNFLIYVIIVFVVLIVLFVASKWYFGRRRITKKILEDKLYAEF